MGNTGKLRLVESSGVQGEESETLMTQTTPEILESVGITDKLARELRHYVEYCNGEKASGLRTDTKKKFDSFKAGLSPEELEDIDNLCRDVLQNCTNILKKIKKLGDNKVSNQQDTLKQDVTKLVCQLSDTLLPIRNAKSLNLNKARTSQLPFDKGGPADISIIAERIRNARPLPKNELEPIQRTVEQISILFKNVRQSNNRLEQAA